MSIVLALLLQTATPTVEQEALGRRVAETGLLSTLLPMLVAKDTDELVAQHPDLSTSEQAALRDTAARTAAAGRERMMAAMGHSYAATLTRDELAALVAFNTGPIAARYRAVQPQAIAAAMRDMAGFDLKAESWRAYCAESGRLCTAK